jgi:hypothetical protein
LEKIGYISEQVAENAILINKGRPLMHNKAKQVQGLAFFEEGILGALEAFKDAQASKDPKIMIQAEQVFMAQELYYNSKKTGLISSLKTAITSFDEALRCLSTLEIPESYRIADTTYGGKGRIKGLPNDAFRMACISNITRLKNNLTTSALETNEIELIEQRKANMGIADEQYAKKQRLVLGLPEKTEKKSKSKKK